MTAREMFGKLGYECEIFGSFIKYSLITINVDNEYSMYNNIFYTDDRKYCSFILNLETFKKEPLLISASLNKAIQKQLEELGWLE